MKRVLLFMISTGIGCNAYSQTDTLAKNEIGVNLISAITSLAGSAHIISKNSVHYKYGLTQKLFLRSEFAYTQGRTFNYYLTPIVVKDSLTSSCLYEHSVDKPAMQISIGIERRWGRKRLRYFAGADLGYKHYKYSRSVYYTERPQNQLPYYNPSTSGVNYYQISYKPTDQLRTIGQSVSNSFLIMPCYGVQFHFARSFFFSAQLRAIIELERTKTTTGTGYNFINNLNFNLSPLDNFSLCYKF